MNNRRQHGWVVMLGLVAGLLTLVGGSAQAQLKITSSVLASGGGAATNGTFVIAGTIGQTIIGPTQSSSLIDAQGFWYTYPTAPINAVPSDPTGATAELRSMPNPFGDYTELSVIVARRSEVTMKLYDGVGRELRTLYSGLHDAGELRVRLSAHELSSGAYTVQLIAGAQRGSTTITVVK